MSTKKTNNSNSSNKSSSKNKTPARKPTAKPTTKSTTNKEQDKILAQDKIQNEVIGIIIAAIGVILFLGIYTENIVGVFGSALKNFLVGILGVGGYIIPLMIIFTGILLILRRFEKISSFMQLCIALLYLSIVTFMQIIWTNPNSLPEYISFSNYITTAYENGAIYNGGVLGCVFGNFLMEFFGKTGSVIILLIAILTLSIYTSRKSFVDYVAVTKITLSDLVIQAKISHNNKIQERNILALENEQIRKEELLEKQRLENERLENERLENERLNEIEQEMEQNSLENENTIRINGDDYPIKEDIVNEINNEIDNEVTSELYEPFEYEPILEENIDLQENNDKEKTNMNFFKSFFKNKDEIYGNDNGNYNQNRTSNIHDYIPKSQTDNSNIQEENNSPNTPNNYRNLDVPNFSPDNYDEQTQNYSSNYSIDNPENSQESNFDSDFDSDFEPISQKSDREILLFSEDIDLSENNPNNKILIPRKSLTERLFGGKREVSPPKVSFDISDRNKAESVENIEEFQEFQEVQEFQNIQEVQEPKAIQTPFYPHKPTPKIPKMFEKEDNPNEAMNKYNKETRTLLFNEVAKEPPKPNLVVLDDEDFNSSGEPYKYKGIQEDIIYEYDKPKNEQASGEEIERNIIIKDYKSGEQENLEFTSSFAKEITIHHNEYYEETVYEEKIPSYSGINIPEIPEDDFPDDDFPDDDFAKNDFNLIDLTEKKPENNDFSKETSNNKVLDNLSEIKRLQQEAEKEREKYEAELARIKHEAEIKQKAYETEMEKIKNSQNHSLENEKEFAPASPVPNKNKFAPISRTLPENRPVRIPQEPIEIHKPYEPPEIEEEEREPYIYEFPSVSLLKNSPQTEGYASKAEIFENSAKLETTLKSFGVEAKVIEANVGPSVTRYELSPGKGVKVSKISGLSDDLALNLAAHGIRIEAPIPGKAAVGIEVPNKEITPVFLKEVINTDAFRNYESKLAFAVGKDIAGNPVVADIAKMPHMLIAGATGSGKSVCINTLITSIIYKADPAEVKLLMVDPKVVELRVYNGIPHLLIPVVTDPKKAAGALNWAVKEMNDRYNMFAESGSRDLKGFNEYRVMNGEDKLPQIVIIIDELADLMMTAAKEVEDSICRLAQMARAAGLHLIIATQRPSVDVITGLIKANIPSRLAFAVSSGTDSRTVLDMTGAEKLLGKGDMLFYPSGLSKPLRVQGAFISDKEVEKIVESVKIDTDANYDTNMINSITSTTKGGGNSNDANSDEDDVTHEAIAFLVKKGKASASSLQRQFRIGYNRASRLIEELENRGIVGPEDGSKPRQVLMTQFEWEEYCERRNNPLN